MLMRARGTKSSCKSIAAPLHLMTVRRRTKRQKKEKVRESLKADAIATELVRSWMPSYPSATTPNPDHQSTI